MFVKYAISSGASNSYTTLNAMVDDIEAIFAGTLTSLSNFDAVCDQSNSFFVGGGSNITNEYSLIRNTSNGDSTDHYLQITKKHSEYSVTYPFQSCLNIYFSKSGTYGVRSFMRGGSNNGSAFPGTYTSNYFGGNTSYKVNMVNPAGTTFWFWANPYNCGFAYLKNDGQEYCSALICDHDITEYNKDVITNNDTHHSGMFYLQGNLAASTYTSSSYTQYNSFAAGVTDYVSNSGSARSNSGFSVTNVYSENYNSNTNLDYCAISPTAYKNVYPLNYPSGTQHQMVPVFLEPSFCSEANGYPVNGRGKYLYRTSDFFGPTGTRITVGGQEYASFVLHKSGGATYNSTSTTEDACYLVPTSIGGY